MLIQTTLIIEKQYEYTTRIHVTRFDMLSKLSLRFYLARISIMFRSKYTQILDVMAPFDLVLGYHFRQIHAN